MSSLLKDLTFFQILLFVVWFRFCWSGTVCLSAFFFCAKKGKKDDLVIISIIVINLGTRGVFGCSVKRDYDCLFCFALLDTSSEC